MRIASPPRRLYSGRDGLPRRRRQSQEGVLDPPHVRGRRAPQGRARRRQGLRLHARQSRDRAAAGRAGRRAARARERRPSPARVHAQRGPPARARGRRQAAAGGDGPALYREPRAHDRGRGRRAQHRAQGAARSRRRGHHGGAVLRRVHLLRGEPRRAARGGAGSATARHAFHRRDLVVEVAGHPRRAHRIPRVLAAHAGGRRAVRGVHLHEPRPRLRERAGALAVGGGGGRRSGHRRRALSREARPHVRRTHAHRLSVREAAGRVLRVSAHADRRRRVVRAPAGRRGRADRARLRLRDARPHPHLAHRRPRDGGPRAARLRARLSQRARVVSVVAEPDRALVRYTHLIYALHAASLVIGIIGTATVVGAFLFGWPSLIAVILNYVKRSEVRGTWLESHFRWQIRTFWFGLLCVALCGLFVVMTLGIAIFIAWIPIGVVGLWFIYRILRGWLALNERRPMYA